MQQPVTLAFDIPRPDRQSRLLIFFRWLLILPHSFVLYFLGLAVMVVTFLAWFAILFTGRYPRGLWTFSMSIMAWNARANGYLLMLRDEYPPFGDGDYPMQFSMHYPERMSRLLIFVKWLLVIPHFVVIWFLIVALGFVYVLAWFAILFTGSFPRSLHAFTVGVNRWIHRVILYLYLLTDVYPPFSLD